MDLNAVKNEMITEARNAANKFFQEKLEGEDRYACGFAWVTVFPEHKGNTKQGKEERKILESLGLRKDWTGKAYEMWNPSGHNCQNIDTKEAGAVAAAAVLKKYGFEAYPGSRLD